MNDLFKGWKNDALTRLLMVNTVVFLVLLIYQAIFALAASDLPFGEDLHLSATANLHVLLHRPWSIITYMFTHIDAGHFLFNVISLYAAGRLFKYFLDEKKLVANYLMGGLSGLALYVLGSHLLPTMSPNSSIVGASAAVMSVVLTIGVYQPNFKVKLMGIFEMELKWLCLILVVLDLVELRKGSNIGGHIGHLGGALFGIIYALQIKKGKNMTSWLERLLDKLSNLFKPRKKMYVVHNNGRPKTDDQFNAERVERQKRVDQILDKISRSGYESLSRDEKEFLSKHG